MIIIKDAKSLDEIFVRVFDTLVDNPNGEVDLQIRPSVFSINNMLLSSSCAMDFDLGMVGLTPTRWPRLINDYVNRNELAQWLPKLKDLNRGREILFPFNRVKPVVRKKMSNYNYGACLLGITYKAYPPKLTLFSRSTNWAQIGALDLSLVSAFAWHISNYLGNIDPSEIEFCWLNSNAYLMAITTMPFLVTHGRLFDVLDGDKLITRDINSLLKYFSTIPNPAFSPINRIRKRISFILDEIQPYVPADQFRLFTPREWEAIKAGAEEKSLDKLKGGYLKIKRHQPGPLFRQVNFDLRVQVEKHKARLIYKNGV